MPIFAANWYLWDQFVHIIQQDILAIGLRICVECSKDESEMHLLLDDSKLLLITLRSDLTKRLRNLSFT